MCMSKDRKQNLVMFVHKQATTFSYTCLIFFKVAFDKCIGYANQTWVAVKRALLFSRGIPEGLLGNKVKEGQDPNISVMIPREY